MCCVCRLPRAFVRFRVMVPLEKFINVSTFRQIIADGPFDNGVVDKLILFELPPNDQGQAWYSFTRVLVKDVLIFVDRMPNIFTPLEPVNALVPPPVFALDAPTNNTIPFASIDETVPPPTYDELLNMNMQPLSPEPEERYVSPPASPLDELLNISDHYGHNAFMPPPPPPPTPTPTCPIHGIRFEPPQIMSPDPFPPLLMSPGPFPPASPLHPEPSQLFEPIEIKPEPASPAQIHPEAPQSHFGCISFPPSPPAPTCPIHGMRFEPPQIMSPDPFPPLLMSPGPFPPASPLHPEPSQLFEPTEIKSEPASAAQIHPEPPRVRILYIPDPVGIPVNVIQNAEEVEAMLVFQPPSALI